VTLHYSDGEQAVILSPTYLKCYQNDIEFLERKLTQLRLEDLAARQEHEKLLKEFYTLYPDLRPDTDQAA